MIEQDLRDGLARAVAAEPPLDFDPDELIARAERETRRRRALAATGALTVLVVLVAVAVPAALGLLRGRPASTPVAGPGQSITTSDSPTPTILAAPVREYSVTELRLHAQKLTDALAQVLPKAVATARHVEIEPWSTAGTPGVITTGPGSLRTFVRLVAQPTPVAIRVQVDAPGVGQPATPGDQCETDQAYGTDCYPTVLAGGDTVLVEELYPDGLPAGRMTSVTDFRPDGSKVSVTAYNWDPTGERPSFTAQPPATSAQLTVLVTDQAINFSG